MKYLKHTIATILLIITLAAVKGQGFKINGRVIGLKDSTWLYLRASKPEKQLDSAMVIDGRFYLSGKIDEKAMSVILHTARYKDYIIFWIENATIDIEVKAGEFKKGIIKGSAAQDEDYERIAAKNLLNSREDRLAAIIKTTTDTGTLKQLQEQIKYVRNEKQDFDKNYIKNHPRSFIAANLLDIYTSTWGKETTSVLYNSLSTEIKRTHFGKEIREYITLAQNINVGYKYADFEQSNVNGKAIKLSSIKGKYILIDFWASWCGPCRAENPALVKAYNLYRDKGFAILGVSLDDNKNDWLKAVKDDKLNWENVSDLRGDKNRAALIYNIAGIPDNFLIDRNGIIIARNLRGKVLEDKLHELLP